MAAFDRQAKKAELDLDRYEDDVDKAVKGSKKKADLTKILTAQRNASVGFDNDKDLNQDRADALDYYRGKPEGAVKRDQPTLANRSTYVSTDVANGVELMLPDLVEVFLAGDDTITFLPVGPEDIAVARQETDYTRHILFQQNRGFLILYTGFKDALISKTGVFHFCWEGEPEYEEYTTTCSEPQLEEIQQQGLEVVSAEPTNAVSMNNFPVFHYTLRKQISDGHVCIMNVPPENFTVHRDTTILADTEYCAMRTSVSRQSLIEKGYKKKDVMKLEVTSNDDIEEMARDDNDEHSNPSEAGSNMLEMVDIITHYIRIDLENTGKRQIWRVVTGNDESIELEREKRSMIEFAAITPFPIPHRFYGQSLADKLIQIQKWKTSVTRAGNDHLYFANNQRQEVKKAGIVVGTTIEQLINNEPGAPVITEDGNSLKPIQNNTLGIDLLGYLEYINTDAENRTGSVRNAGGLNPDTMHETKGGAEMLNAAALKRVRMMARLFAETGLKDLFVGIHDLARQNATMKDTIELRGKWVDVAPSEWRRRKDMKINIGIGSGGTEDDLLRQREWRGALAQIVEVQGGVDDPDGIVTKQTIYDTAVDLADKLKIPNADRQLQNPTDVAKRKAMTGEKDEPQEPPEVTKMKMELQVEQQTQAARIQLETEKAKTKAQIDIATMREQAAVERERMEGEMKLKREMAALEAQIAREKFEAERQLELDRATFEAQLAEKNAEREFAIAKFEAHAKAQNEADAIKKNRPGGSLAK